MAVFKTLDDLINTITGWVSKDFAKDDPVFKPLQHAAKVLLFDIRGSSFGSDIDKIIENNSKLIPPSIAKPDTEIASWLLEVYDLTRTTEILLKVIYQYMDLNRLKNTTTLATNDLSNPEHHLFFSKTIKKDIDALKDKLTNPKEINQNNAEISKLYLSLHVSIVQLIYSLIPDRPQLSKKLSASYHQAIGEMITKSNPRLATQLQKIADHPEEKFDQESLTTLIENEFSHYQAEKLLEIIERAYQHFNYSIYGSKAVIASGLLGAMTVGGLAIYFIAHTGISMAPIPVDFSHPLSATATTIAGIGAGVASGIALGSALDDHQLGTIFATSAAISTMGSLFGSMALGNVSIIGGAGIGIHITRHLLNFGKAAFDNYIIKLPEEDIRFAKEVALPLMRTMAMTVAPSKSELHFSKQTVPVGGLHLNGLFSRVNIPAALIVAEEKATPSNTK